jgi:hypothetical protein
MLFWGDMGGSSWGTRVPQAQLATAGPSAIDNPGPILDGGDGAAGWRSGIWRAMHRAGMAPTIAHVRDVVDLRGCAARFDGGDSAHPVGFLAPKCLIRTAGAPRRRPAEAERQRVLSSPRLWIGCSIEISRGPNSENRQRFPEAVFEIRHPCPARPDESRVTGLKHPANQLE